MARRRQFETLYESPVLPFAERVMWKDPTLQPEKLRSSWGNGLWLGRSQTSNDQLFGTRVGIVVARTIRRLPSTEREDASLVMAMRSTPVAGRTADAVVRREVIVVPASSGAPVAEASAHLHILTVTCLSPWSRVHTHRRLQKSAANIQVAKGLSILVLEMSLPRSSHTQRHQL